MTETTKYPDGSQTVVETKKDGTVTKTVKGADGSTSQTVTRPDGSITFRAETSQRIKSAFAMDSNGGITLTILVPAEAVPSGTPLILDTPAGVIELPADMLAGMEGDVSIAFSLTPAEGSGDTIAACSLSVTAGGKQFYGARLRIDISKLLLLEGRTSLASGAGAAPPQVTMPTLVARLDGVDTAGGSAPYEKAMAWAVAKGVSDGANPERPITREQLVVMLYRVAGEPATHGSLPGFRDAAQAGGYAVTALEWAVENGIIGGTGGRLNPKGSATRAQTAAMLQRFLLLREQQAFGAALLRK